MDTISRIKEIIEIAQDNKKNQILKRILKTSTAIQVDISRMDLENKTIDLLKEIVSDRIHTLFEEIKGE